MKNKYLSIILSILVVLILASTFCLFILNIIIQEFKLGSTFSLLDQALATKEEFTPLDFGHQIGEEVSDPLDCGVVVKVGPGDFQESGQNYVNLGPNIFLAPGKYQITYDFSISGIGGKEDFAKLDVFRINTGTISEKTLNSSSYVKDSLQKESLNFETDGGRGFEFRVLYLGKGELKVGSIKVESTSKNYSLLFKKIVNKATNKIKQILKI